MIRFKKAGKKGSAKQIRLSRIHERESRDSQRRFDEESQRIREENMHREIGDVLRNYGVRF